MDFPFSIAILSVFYAFYHKKGHEYVWIVLHTCERMYLAVCVLYMFTWPHTALMPISNLSASYRVLHLLLVFIASRCICVSVCVCLYPIYTTVKYSVNKILFIAYYYNLFSRFPLVFGIAKMKSWNPSTNPPSLHPHENKYGFFPFNFILILGRAKAEILSIIALRGLATLFRCRFSFLLTRQTCGKHSEG